MKTKEQVIIGPLPPPLGGVANHIERTSKKHNLIVLDTKTIRNKRKTFELLLQKNSDIYVHSTSWYIAFVLLAKSMLLNRQCDYYFVNHNFSLITSKNKGIKNRVQHFLRYALIKRCKRVYVVNKSLIPKMVKVYGELHYEVLDPFVAPNIEEEEAIIDTYEPSLLHFIESHSSIICSGAWVLSFHEGKDLYGFDLLIDMMAVLTKTYPHIGLVFFLGNPNHNTKYLMDCERKIEKFGLSKNIHVEKHQKQMWPILKRSNLFIRATNTDGDPLSIKEALFFNTKVLASDCTTRTPKVQLFKSRNISSLINATVDILAKEMVV